MWSQIGIDLIGTLREIDGYKYTGTAGDYISKFVDAIKGDEAVEVFLYKLLCRYCSHDIYITERELVNSITVEFYQLTGTYHCITSRYHLQAN